jgi:nucleotidyltransferase substrate binding protein (TIGR01987 family)
MEKIKDRYEIAVQTLKTFKEALDILEQYPTQEYYLFICDSAIQRFEYSIDTFWKFIKLYMTDILNITIDVASPRPILREAVNAKLLTEDEFKILLRGIIRRNETSHAYNKELAGHILTELPNFYVIMHNVLTRMT